MTYAEKIKAARAAVAASDMHVPHAPRPRPPIYRCVACQKRKVESATARCAVCAPNIEHITANDRRLAAWADQEMPT